MQAQSLTSLRTRYLEICLNDCFLITFNHISVDYLNQNNGFYQINDTRTFALSFSYRLGKIVTAARKYD
jgi:hypothetical protein